jgi:hypothetical protein
MFNQTRPRSIRRISANKSRWATHYLPVRMKMITKALNAPTPCCAG